jgi:hypothetical protein
LTVLGRDRRALEFWECIDYLYVYYTHRHSSPHYHHQYKLQEFGIEGTLHSNNSKRADKRNTDIDLQPSTYVGCTALCGRARRRRRTRGTGSGATGGSGGQDSCRGCGGRAAAASAATRSGVGSARVGAGCTAGDGCCDGYERMSVKRRNQIYFHTAAAFSSRCDMV